MAYLDLKQVPVNIHDLIDQKNTPADSLFYRYKDKKEIGEKIFKELIRRFAPPKYMDDPSNGGRMGFFTDDSSRQIGLLSQSQGLQALLLLASDFNLDFDEVYDGTKTVLQSRDNNERSNLTIRMIMDLVIQDIINRLTKKKAAGDNDNDYDADNDQVDLYSDQNAGGKYVFDASPYDTDAFDDNYAYIDCITWVLPTFFLVLRYHVDIGEICRYEREMIAIIKAGLAHLNEAYIHPENAPEGLLTRGWNFTKDCEEPSLYFTYAVAECYLDLYNNFDKYLEDVEALRDEKEKGIPLDPATAERIRIKKEQYDEVLAEKSLDSITYTKGEKAFFGKDSYNELKRIYMAINDGADDFNSPYGTLDKYCKEVAGMIWSLVKDKFADFFYFNDLHATVTEEDLGMSTTNDALFNSMYIINILLDAGLDEEIKSRITVANMLHDDASDEEKQKAEKEANEAQNEYDNLLDTCQMALQKAIRAYEKLKNQSREYIVDQFLVGFNEKFVKLEDKVRELRKLRIRVFSLVPLFIKTNSVIGEYLVKYPQNNMKKYLGYILENRFLERDKSAAARSIVHWIWEQDGYFSASNYYYISALSDFYRYYENFEAPYVDEETKIKEIRETFYQELTGDKGEITLLQKDLEDAGKTLNQTVAKKDAEIAKIQQQLDAVETPIEDAVKKVIEDRFPELLPTMLTDYFKSVTDALVGKQLKNGKVSKQHLEFKDTMLNLLLSFYARQIATESEYDISVADTAEERYAILVDNAKKDLVEIMDMQMHSVSSSMSKTSTLNKLIKDNSVSK